MHKPIPPHLPAKASSLAARRLYRTIPQLIVFTVLAFVAASAAFLSIVAWVLPENSTTVSGTMFSRPRVNTVNESLSPLISFQLSERMIDLYDRKQTSYDGVYTKEAELGSALVVSSDGWAVLSLPTSTLSTSSLVGVASDGEQFRVDTVIPDTVFGVLYVHFVGNAFRVISFDTRNSLFLGTEELFRLTSGGTYTLFQDDMIITPPVTVRGIWEPVLPLLTTTEKGTVIVRNDGSVVGLVNNTNHVVTAPFLLFQLRSILDGRVPVYRGPAWEGREIVGVETKTGFVFTPGFVLDVVPPRMRDLVRPGDVVTHLLDTRYSSGDAFFIFASEKDTIRVHVLRDGEERIIEIPNPIQFPVSLR